MLVRGVNYVFFTQILLVSDGNLFGEADDRFIKTTNFEKTFILVTLLFCFQKR